MGLLFFFGEGGQNVWLLFHQAVWRFGRCGNLIRIHIGSIIAYSKSGACSIEKRQDLFGLGKGRCGEGNGTDLPRRVLSLLPFGKLGIKAY